MKVIVGRTMEQATRFARSKGLKLDEVILVSTEGGDRNICGLSLREEDVKFVGDWFRGKYVREIEDSLKLAYIRFMSEKKNKVSKFKVIARSYNIKVEEKIIDKLCKFRRKNMRRLVDELCGLHGKNNSQVL